MKKWYITLAVLFLALLLLGGVPILRSYMYKGYTGEINIHSTVHDTFGDTLGTTEEGTVELSDANLYYFEQAISRSTLVYRLVKPNTESMPCVTVSFYDGATYEVYDAGETKKGRDLAYIVYQYDGRSLCFSAEGLGTYQRIYLCASPGGFSGENISVTSSDTA